MWLRDLDGRSGCLRTALRLPAFPWVFRAVVGLALGPGPSRIPSALQPFPTLVRPRAVRVAACAVGALVTLTVALSACSGADEHGSVTGVAAPCGGPQVGSGLPGWALQPVRVSAILNDRTVASEVVSYRKDRDRYQLSLRPGHYAIVSAGDPLPGTAVNLRPGQRIRLNLPDRCA